MHRVLYPHKESNLDNWIRNPGLYPLSYEGIQSIIDFHTIKNTLQKQFILQEYQDSNLISYNIITILYALPLMLLFP